MRHEVVEGLTKKGGFILIQKKLTKKKQNSGGLAGKKILKAVYIGSQSVAGATSAQHNESSLSDSQRS